MRIEANSPTEYISKVQEVHRSSLKKLRSAIKKNLPDGFKEVMSYGMIGYVVPKSIYPQGYHVDPSLPLPFINIASQKNFIALYHSGLYADPILHDWFVKEYEKVVPTKLDMGKSCVRFKNPDQIPFDLISSLCEKLSPEQWITLYEENLKKVSK
jgi:uncharacterized protein YdhG (YjbR/CyaY superfamily)